MNSLSQFLYLQTKIQQLIDLRTNVKDPNTKELINREILEYNRQQFGLPNATAYLTILTC
jgi:hypothetical protein